jgi:cytochrome c-type biogenesis protein CcmH
VTLVPVIGFGAVALLAILFATFAVLRGRGKGWPLLAGAIALFLLGVGGGTYWMTGQPALAQRDAQGMSAHDVKGLIPFLIARVRKEPGDLQAWIYLGGAYMTANDPGDAAKAYGRAVTVARIRKTESAGLDSAYGEALVASNSGAVSDDAANAFSAALSLNPKDPGARFFMAQYRAEHGDKAGAMSLLQSLMAETPANSPLHQTLVDRMALLTAQGGGANGMNGGPPDPRAMVAQLAGELKAEPHNAAGWRRLIRAYTVLGQPDDAKTALATARKTFAGDKDVLAQLDADAQDLKIK